MRYFSISRWCDCKCVSIISWNITFTSITSICIFWISHTLSYAIVVYYPFDYPSLCRWLSGTVPCVLRLWPYADHNDDCTVCDRHCQASFSCLVDRIVRIWAWHTYLLEIYKLHVYELLVLDCGMKLYAQIVTVRALLVRSPAMAFLCDWRHCSLMTDLTSHVLTILLPLHKSCLWLYSHTIHRYLPYSNLPHLHIHA
jgi:hypothetical protein